MKTTLELPDPLLRRVKVRAAQTDRRLKDVVAELIEKGLDAVTAAGGTAPESPAPRRSLPVLKRQTGRMLSVEDIDAAIADNRFAHLGSLDELNRYLDELRADRDDASA
ncbi:MAG: hypothetical protein IPK48_13510 [Gammaproteobacteria bacterium]|nr:hypothetical protein [Gammaproteobacteria bacterium]